MSAPSPSQDLNQWDLALIDQLINYPSVESETFDFKGATLNELETHICAMGNTSGGVLALGIEDAAHPGGPFIKSGFAMAKKNSILTDVGNYTYMVEPHPKTVVKTIDDINGKFYVVLKVEKELANVPYAIKQKGQFYVRVGASTRPASRNTILNLFSGVREKLTDVEMLRSSCLATRNAFIQTARIIDFGNYTSSHQIPRVDLSFLRSATIRAEWFLIHNNMLGEVDARSSRGGMYIQIHSIDQMNSYINGFNATFQPNLKQEMLTQLTPWATARSAYASIVPFFDGLITLCQKFIDERTS